VNAPDPTTKNQHVLVVEDDRAVRESLRRSLEFNGYRVSTAADGAEALAGISGIAPDAVVMDVMMPRLDGLETTKALRKVGNSVPILVLTARDAVGDRVEGLDAGADDYLTKPFRMEEVVMRLRAMVRRSTGHADNRIVCGPLAFDAGLGTFELDGLPLKLTALEWRVLSCMILRRSVVVSRADLNEHAYDGDAEVDSNSLEVIVARLRRKIGHAMIETVRGRGYRLTDGAP
jgi:two-component system OmpR family response regulator